jgi:hypothetical protein
MKSVLVRLLLIVAVAVAPALIFQTYTEIRDRELRRQFMEDQALRLVRLVNAEQRRIVEGAEQVLTLMGSFASNMTGSEELCQHILADLLHQSPRYLSASIVGLDGHLVCAPPSFDRTKNLTERAYFHLAMQTGHLAIGEYVLDWETGLQTVHIAKPYKDVQGPLPAWPWCRSI